jgi:uroporphyrinogen decarboxylase
MNSRERYRRAITFAGPDRVPLMQRALPGARRKYGQALQDLYARFPGDVLLSPSTGGWFGFRRAVGENSGALRGVTDEWGCVWDSLTEDYLGQVVGHPLDEWGKLEGFAWPEPAVGIEGAHEMVEVVKTDGHQHYALIEIGSLWHRTNWLRGFENSLVDVVEDCPEMYLLRDRLTEFLLKRVEILRPYRDCIDGIQVNDDWGTQLALMIKPDHWRKIYKPAYAKIVEAIKDGGCFAHLHTDGVTDAILEDLIEIGFDEVNPQMSCMDIEALGRRFGGRICFRADLDRQVTLPFGTPADVEAYIHRLFAAFGRRNGGYIGYGQVGTDVPLANAEAMLATFSRLHYPGASAPTA